MRHDRQVLDVHPLEAEGQQTRRKLGDDWKVKYMNNCSRGDSERVTLGVRDSGGVFGAGKGRPLYLLRQSCHLQGRGTGVTNPVLPPFTQVPSSRRATLSLSKAILSALSTGLTNIPLFHLERKNLSLLQFPIPSLLQCSSRPSVAVLIQVNLLIYSDSMSR